MFARLPGVLFAPNTSVISDVTTTVGCPIRIDYFTVVPGIRYSEPVVVANHRCRVDHKNYDFALLRFAQERNHALIRIMEVDPFETFVGIVQVPKRRFTSINVIKMLNQTP